MDHMDMPEVPDIPGLFDGIDDGVVDEPWAPWSIINGKQFGSSQGKKVSVTGFVIHVSPNGKSFDMRTVDDVTVTVNLNMPIDDMVEGYLEVHGVVQSNTVMTADNYLQFDSRQSENFDLESHNELCQLLAEKSNVYEADEDV